MSGAILRSSAALLGAVLLAGCGGEGPSAAPPAAGLSAQAQAGRALFFDRTLSASGAQSCATCHVPGRAFTADPATDRGLPVPLGGRGMDLPGFRNAPSLVYAALTPAFDPESLTGGFFRDGRASSLAVQAQQPFVTRFEMANADAAEVVMRLEASPQTLAAFTAAYGATVLSDSAATLARIGEAIAAFETEAPQFHPFSSKFDYWLQGRASFSDAELRGIALFNNPGKGNCNACHPSARQQYSDHALFTDFSYDNIGVPRNWAIPANSPDPVSPVSGVPLDYVPAQAGLLSDAPYAYYDLGLCGPFAPPATDPAPRRTYGAGRCGLFKVPTLRNVALTAPYFHNGNAADLHQALQFYVTRDINNNQGNNPFWVPAGPGGNPYAAAGSFFVNADGSSALYQYNDIPLAFNANVNVGENPYTPPTFSGGNEPTLTAAEIDDVVAFLCTLTDGFDPDHPSAYSVPAQCAPQAR
ncbi:MAG: diacylglycerol kinase [Proteobacteria bacterium]|nr:diacylglycerol kinase [Pseudomonadota bacterium]